MIKTIIGNTDVTTYVPFKSINMNDSLTIKSDSLSFSLYIDSLLSIPAPKAGQIVQVRYYWDVYPQEYVDIGVYETSEILFDASENKYYTLEFEGGITTVTRKWKGPPNWLEYSCTCSDYTRQFDRNLVNKVYTAGQYAGDIVRDIVANYVSSDFTVNHVDPGYKVPEMTFDFAEPSTCIQELAESIGYQWYVDFYKDVHFYWNENNLSPFAVGGTWGPGLNILYVDSEIKYAYNLEITEDISQLKNKILVKNANFKGTYINEDFVEAQSKFFKAFYNIFPGWDSSTTQEDRAKQLVIEIYYSSGGTLTLDYSRPITTILLDDIEGKAGDGQGDLNTIYVNFGSGFRLPDNYPLASGQVMRVYYSKMESIPILEIDQNSIDAMKKREGGTSTGIYEYAFDASTIYTEKGKELTVAVDRVLLRYRDPLITGTFQTRLRGWKAGQALIVYSDRWGFGVGDPISEVVWVKDVSKTVLNHELIEYTISFSSSPLGD